MGKTALLVIDVQKGLDDPYHGKRNNPDAESNMVLLLSKWRKLRLPIVHVKHSSVEPNSKLRPELRGNEVKDEVKPLAGEKQFTKSVNSVFIGTGLEKHLREHDISSLVIVGLTTDHCVSAATRMASDLGFDVTVVSDATATHERLGYDGVLYSADDIHKINLVSLNGEFCAVRSTREVLKEIV
ncbi:MAG: cysteine hydrolase [SAR202 cluster bacterium]|nr:cysteine hydrolase [SAR202 cluster bacterium]